MFSDPGQSFNFSAAIEKVCRDMIARLPEFSHIDFDRVAVSLVQARRDVSHGIYASLTPLRFEGGAREKRTRGRRYLVQSVCDRQGREYLYILSIYLPRFLNTSLEEKLATLLHELWHIGPNFDGDLRRFPGRNYAHGNSQREYDAQMERFAQQWLAADPPAHLYDFLEFDFNELTAEHGRIVGTRWPAPKLIPA
ncbi:MAG: putative metallopeptidase [Lacipirellulaceae bacterium]